MSQSTHIYGIHAVQSALVAGQGIRLRVRPGRLNDRQSRLVQQAYDCGCDVIREDFESGGADQGVALEIQPPAFRTEQDLKQSLRAKEDARRLYLVLDGVTDPRNFGACLRSAVSFGATGVIVPADNSAPLNTAAIKTASGAASLVPVYQVVNLARCLETMKKDSVWVVGTVPGVGRKLSDVDLRGDIALVMGAEDTGIRRNIRNKCDFLAEISTPFPGLSLNVSVAAGICLYEATQGLTRTTLRGNPKTN